MEKKWFWMLEKMDGWEVVRSSAGAAKRIIGDPVLPCVGILQNELVWFSSGSVFLFLDVL